MFVFVLLMCVALFGSGSTEGKLTRDNFMAVSKAYFKEFCGELLQKKLLDALQACAEKYHNELKEAVKNCVEITGNGANTYYDYLKAACEDESMEPKYMECIGKKADDPEFRKKAANSTAAEACYDETFKDMGIKKVEGIYFKLVDE